MHVHVDAAADSSLSRQAVCRAVLDCWAQVRESHREMLAEHHASFHSTWGQLLKTGYQNSRFAHQVLARLLRSCTL